MKKIEILAPAGDIDRAKIAFLYGADAIYIGGKEYSLRANAQNFSINEINEITKFAHSFKKKVYVTFNIIFHNEDLDGYKEYLNDLISCEIDAIILADPFLIPIIKKKYPDIKIILSTQNGAANIENVLFWKSEGVDRVVLARELSKEEIKEIKDKTSMELEVFIHGAMCTNFSGRCVLSNYFTNRDANRGGCAQICRYCFKINDNSNNIFAISPKDLNMAEHIGDLIKIGVDSIKIEGRMRSAYYLATVISSYRRLVDAYYKEKLTPNLVVQEEKILQRVANRESSTHFFKKKADVNDQYYVGRDEVSNQDFLGFVLDYDETTKILTLEERNKFSTGDKVIIFGPNGFLYKFKIKEIYDEDMNVIDCARHAKQIIKLKVSRKIPKYAMMKIEI